MSNTLPPNDTYLGEPSGDETDALSPIWKPDVRARRRFGSTRSIVIASIIALAVLSFFALKIVGDATLYFRTADEAVANKSSLGSKKFRLEGCVVPGSVIESGNEVRFLVAGSNVNVDVINQGSPPDLFQDSIPVVMEGRWTNDVFQSDRILVRHSETYQEENADRVDPLQCTSDGDAARVS